MEHTWSRLATGALPGEIGMMRAKVPGVDGHAALGRHPHHLAMKQTYVDNRMHALGDSDLIGDHGETPSGVLEETAHGLDHRSDELAVLDAVHVACVKVYGAVSVEECQAVRVADVGEHGLGTLIALGHADVDEAAFDPASHKSAVVHHAGEPVIHERENIGLGHKRIASYEIGAAICGTAKNLSQIRPT